MPEDLGAGVTVTFAGAEDTGAAVCPGSAGAFAAGAGGCCTAGATADDCMGEGFGV